MRRLLFFLLLCIVPLFGAPSKVIKLEIKGAVGPATSNYLKEGMLYADRQQADMVLIELDTPGGLASSMREMIQQIANSRIPVIVYVAPKGARAASAGTYLIYAAHVAVMAPGTNLGAATPVNMLSPATLPDTNGSAATVLEKKAINDAKAYIKSLAQLNERNITWALEAVEKAESIPAYDALRYGVIDLVAEDTDTLLQKLDGMSVKIGGRSVELNTQEVSILLFEADWKTRMLAIITDPNIAYILLIIAIYGIFFELLNPGGFVPGVIGVISGVLALYALNMLPFNYAGLLLILLGVGLMVAEVLIAGFGILGIGGVISFAFGSLLLFDTETLGAGVSIPLIIAITLVSLIFFIYVIRFLIRSRSAKAVSGAEEMIGADAKVLEVTEDGYRVRCHGEIWFATSKVPLEVGQSAKVESLEGLTLHLNLKKE
ncbi:MAG: nodulation protein NfeD [Sulfurovum sp.]|nr:nodulation protein NfeD [Sulfurovum sp.]